MEVKEDYYENSPIILSMIQFRYDKIDGFDVDVIKKMAKKVETTFPVVNQRFVHNIVVNNDKNSKTSVSIEDQQVDGVQVMSKNRQEFFTITDTKFTFQSHEKYTGWDNFRDKAFQFWHLFNNSFNIKELSGVSLRYVNRINLPLDLKRIDKYFTTYIKDDNNTFSIANFQLKFSSFDKENKFRFNISHLLDAPLDEYVPYIFDIDVLSDVRIENKNDLLLALFEKIRDKKNKLFNDGITDETKKTNKLNMPFIIDLPPSNTHVESVKTEMISIEGSENNIPTIDDRSIVFEKDLYENIYLNDKFKSLVELWEQNTAFESSISNIIQEDNFKKIINLGKKAVPLIIDKIEYEPSVLVWALNIITGKSMSSGGRETIEQICKKWVNAFRTGRIQNV